MHEVGCHWPAIGCTTYLVLGRDTLLLSSLGLVTLADESSLFDFVHGT